MGVVYLAWHSELGCELAIKALLFRRSDEDAQRRRFQREIRALTKLRHPNLVEILDAGEKDGVPWFAMRRVVGESLEDRLHTQGPLTPQKVMELGIQLCRGVGAAHAQNLLHRDLKPDNVLCAANGYVVTDFGLTKDLSSEDSVVLTQTGLLQGTPGYWAPEQATGDGNKATKSTDVYGVGAVLYGALTGKPPVDGETFVELLVATRERTPTPPSALVPVPEDLEAVILRCLKKSPDDRYLSLHALEDELRGLSGAENQNPSASRSRRSLLLALLAILGMGALTVAGVAVLPSSSPAVVSNGERPDSPPSSDAKPSHSPRPRTTPNWFSELAKAERPQLPLPRGLSPGQSPGEYVNSKDGSKLVWVPPGSFTMGSDTSGAANEQPAHLVTFAEGFFIGKHEITWRQYEAYCTATGQTAPSRAIDLRFLGGVLFRAKDDHPVFNVNWDEVQGYCDWARLRLPTEAEWEFCARGPESTRWPWGNANPDRTRLNLVDKTTRWDWPDRMKESLKLSKAPWRDGFPYTAPVGTFPKGASPFGCLDMAGNVLEWVEDSYEATYKTATPIEPRRGDGRVYRGGGWGDPTGRCRSAYRAWMLRSMQKNDLGFRPARTHR